MAQIICEAMASDRFAFSLRLERQLEVKSQGRASLTGLEEYPEGMWFWNWEHQLKQIR